MPEAPDKRCGTCRLSEFYTGYGYCNWRPIAPLPDWLKFGPDRPMIYEGDGKDCEAWVLKEANDAAEQAE